MKNYFDEKGNYINIENLSLKQIYERAFDEGYKKGYIDGALHPTNEEENEAAYNEGYAHGIVTKLSHYGWITVSERLPENRDWYLGLFKEPDTDFIGIPYICDYVGEVTKGTTNEGWILRHCTDVDNASDYFRNLICVAWQPLPEPYKEGEEE